MEKKKKKKENLLPAATMLTQGARLPPEVIAAFQEQLLQVVELFQGLRHHPHHLSPDEGGEWGYRGRLSLWGGLQMWRWVE